MLPVFFQGDMSAGSAASMVILRQGERSLGDLELGLVPPHGLVARSLQ